VGGSSRSPHHRFYLDAKLTHVPVRLVRTQASGQALALCGDATVRLCGERADEVTNARDGLRGCKVHIGDYLCDGTPPSQEGS
jgi:hypothetical protein